MNLEKSINSLSERLERIEEEEITNAQANDEDDDEIEARFAKLREARIKVTDAFADKTGEDVWDNISQEEIEYYKRKNLDLLKKDTKSKSNSGIFINQAGICEE